jgi:hypothetical protein
MKSKRNKSTKSFKTVAAAASVANIHVRYTLFPSLYEI